MFVRLHDELIELPTAVRCTDLRDRVAMLDKEGTVVAWFDRVDVIAYSEEAGKLRITENSATRATDSAQDNGHVLPD